MVLASEQVRQVKNEANYINDATGYSRTASSWGTVKDYGNITLTEDGIVALNFSLNLYSYTGYFRVKIGSFYVWGIKWASQPLTNFGLLVWLTAGTYDVLVEGKADGTHAMALGLFQAGFVKLTDAVGSALADYASSALTVASRTTPIGVLKEAVYGIQLFGLTAAGQTNFENVGDVLTNGVSVLVDGVQVSSSERNQDADSVGCASAKYYIPCAVGVSHTVTISKRNAATAVEMSIVACPWILSDSAHQHRPTTLSFPPYSTLYVTKEPLFLNATGYIQVGKVRAVSFGVADDFYYQVSGTDIVYGSYTFQTVALAQVEAWVYGLGTCISQIAVDRR